MESAQIIYRRVIPIDEQGQEIKVAAVILEGDISSVQTDLLFWRDVFSKQYPGSTLKVISIKQGSIKLIIEGTQKDIEMLLSNFESGNLTEIEGFPVKDAQLLTKSAEDDESSKQKWRLVEEIITNPIEGRDLSGADLSDADLSNASLIDANLSNADLSGADLSGASLSGVNMKGVNLRDADLRNAKLSDAEFNDAKVNRTLFGNNLGISKPLKQDLIRRGAIFEDSPGDRSLVMTGAHYLQSGNLGIDYMSGGTISQMPESFNVGTVSSSIRPIELLLVEDSSGDADLIEEALSDSKVLLNLHWVEDGVEALAFLRRQGKYADAPRPDLILLDLNLPKKDGREVLAQMKGDKSFKLIPVLILTTSATERDILKTYELNANCYIVKPFDLEQFISVVKLNVWNLVNSLLL